MKYLIMMKNLEKSVDALIADLTEKEKQQDIVLQKMREIVRACSKAIKNIHGDEIKKNEDVRKNIKKEIKDILKYRLDFKQNIDHTLQEYCEMEITNYVKENLMNMKELPTNDDLNCPLEPYIMGLLDVFGELKREIVESLRKDDKKSAEKYFEVMEKIYETLLPIRFSESLLPGFRRKQDMARIQVESARSELLRK